MTGRVVARLSELVDNSDLRRRPVKSSDRGHGRYPYYGASGVVDFIDKHIYDGEYLLISEDGENLRTRATPIAFLARGQFWVNNHAHVVRANRRSDTRYLMYHLAYLDISGYLTGSTLPKLTRSAMDSIILNIPSPADQVAIGRVLGALDDKIAANAELARTADRLACGLFTRSVAGVESGPHSFGDLCAVGGGGTPKSFEPTFWSGNIDWATPTDVTRLSGPYLRSTAKRITSEGLAACSSRLYPVNSILMTSRATIGSFALAKAPMAVNQGFIVVNPTDNQLCYWFLHEMRSRVDEFNSRANGATFLELSRGDFKKLPVRLTDPAAMTEFCSLAGGLHDLANQALIESDALATMRDTLLPHLMSGRLKVRDAEKRVSDAV